MATMAAVALTKDASRTQDFHAGRIKRHSDHRLGLVLFPVGVGDSQHDTDLAVGAHRTARPPLGPLDAEAALLLVDPRRDVVRIGTGYGRLRHGVDRADLAVEELRKPLVADSVGREVVQHFHVPGVRGRAVHGFGHDPRTAASDLGDLRVFEIRQPDSGEEQVPQATGARFDLEVLDDRRCIPRTDLVLLLVVDRLGRDYPFVQKVERLCLKVLDLVGGSEFHGCLPLLTNDS